MRTIKMLCVIMKFKEFDEKYGGAIVYLVFLALGVGLFLYLDILSWGGLGILAISLAGLISFIIILQAVVLSGVNVFKLKGKPKLIFYFSMTVSVICIPAAHYFIPYTELVLVYFGVILIFVALCIQRIKNN
jgi:hypothetical protein